MKDFEIVIFGATPGGLATAITAGRLGRRVAVLDQNDHIGGMTTSGLGKSDVEQKEYIGGLFREFTKRVYSYYRDKYGPDSENVKLCREGYYFEPSTAENVLNEMIGEAGDISIFLGYKLKHVTVYDDCIKSIRTIHTAEGSLHSFSGQVFVDATYEGDLYAGAGAEYRLGREGRTEFSEPHAGKIFYDYENGKILPGSTGEGDNAIQAYTYRYCLTTDPDNSYVLSKLPENYDRNLYTGYFDDLNKGRLSAPAKFHDGWGYYPEHFDTMVRVLSVTDLPNSKVDANTNPRPLAFPFPEENIGYIEGNSEIRKRICDRHREISLGLIWFLQNDMEVPEKHRKMARKYNFPLDEFVDNNHFPFQLYVREGRRLKGEYTLTQHDVSSTLEHPESFSHPDTIAMGEFPIDSFPVHKISDENRTVLEGYLGMLAHLTSPYEIPYRAMIPEKIDGLIVPVALSATHVAYCSIRMEPTWMSLGQAAGVAAHVSIEEKSMPRAVSIQKVREILKNQGQKLSSTNGDL